MNGAVDIEAMNAVRIALGQKPLEVPGQSKNTNGGLTFKESKDDASSDEEAAPVSTLDTQDVDGVRNWQKLEEQKQQQQARDAKKEIIRKAREKAQRNAVLAGRGLGEGDEVAHLDAKSWLKGMGKRGKKIEEERQKQIQKELEEREKLAAIGYTSKDLAGIRVGHEVGRFDEGDEHILTLADTAVDADDAEDELENLDLRNREKLEERLESKKKKPVYNPHDADDYTAGPKKILAQYDEEIEGKKRHAFTLDAEGTTAEAKAAAAAEAEAERPKGIYINLDELSWENSPEYLKQKAEKAKKEKKPKRKKKDKSEKKAKAIRQKKDDDEDIFLVAEQYAAADATPAADDTMEIDQTNGDGGPVYALKPQKRSATAAFQDDESLQDLLAIQRRANLKKRKKAKPDEIIRQLQNQESEDEYADMDIMQTTEAPDEEEDQGLVIDETTEFVSTLQKPEDRDQRRRAKSTPAANGIETPHEVKDEDGDVDMEQSYAEVADAQERAERAQRAIRGVSAAADVADNGLGEEETIGAGVGGILNMLKSRKVLDHDPNSHVNEEFLQKSRFLAERHKREDAAEARARLQREKERASGRNAFLTTKEKEDAAQKANTAREHELAREQAELFNRNYKPKVEIKYTDDHGRDMNQKEAFKYMSHQFHGKGSGKGKTEKRLKKITQENQMEARSIMDATQDVGGIGMAQSEQARRKKQAGVRLQ